MRRLLLVSGLLLGGALLASSQASAGQVGCACVKVGSKLGSAPVCVASIEACAEAPGGLCVSPCDYTPPKAAKKSKKKNKM